MNNRFRPLIGVSFYKPAVVGTIVYLRWLSFRPLIGVSFYKRKIHWCIY